MRVVSITGTSRGVGKALAEKFLLEGFLVKGVSRFSSDIVHPNFLEKILDVRKKEHQKEVIDFFEGSDIVIFNAGVGHFGMLEDLKPLQVLEIMETNLLSPIVLTQGLVKTAKEKGGRFIYMGSEAAINPGKMGTIYTSAKAGLRMFVQSLFCETRGTALSVGMIHPGMIRSSFFDDLHFLPKEGAEYALSIEEVVETIFLFSTHFAQKNIFEIEMRPEKNGIVWKR